LIYLQQLNSNNAEVTSIYSPVMLYTTQVLDAAVQNINALHRQNPFDFGISLGDVANSTQYNETRWYIDVLDGKVINPSSGAHAESDAIDYQKPFKAAGLDRTIPWYHAMRLNRRPGAYELCPKFDELIIYCVSFLYFS